MTPEERAIRKDQMERDCRAVCSLCREGVPVKAVPGKLSAQGRMVWRHLAKAWRGNDYVTQCFAQPIRRAWEEQVKE